MLKWARIKFLAYISKTFAILCLLLFAQRLIENLTISKEVLLFQEYFKVTITMPVILNGHNSLLFKGETLAL